ncbi:MAG: hypothetical protein Q9208_005749 [Pyrenodesmia sp. 3 TL-2023]
MTTAAGYFDRKPNTAARPAISHLQPDPSSPHTPPRTFASAFSSPSLSYRAEDEVLVFDLGARHLSAGVAGESNPRCRLGFSPDTGRRVGDYRQYMPAYQDRPRKRRRRYDWGEDHELWRMDLREVDLGLVEDKVERAVRKAYTEHLLLDSKNKRLNLILPSLMPHRLLSSVLSSIFSNFQTPSITLFSSPILNVAAAGCRAGLVVDIGWAETVMTGVYEHREVSCTRTTRAMKLVTRRMADLLKEHMEPGATDTHQQPPADNSKTHPADFPLPDSRYFDFAEEVTSRIAWCPTETQNSTPPKQATESPTAPKSHPPSAPPEAPNHDTIAIPSPLPPRKTLHIPFPSLATPIEHSLFAPTQPLPSLDDHEQPLPHLLYKTLLSLPPDVRAHCMARIIITGGGSNIPGLKTRLLNELRSIVEQRGWDPVYGDVAIKAREHRQTVRDTRLHKEQDVVVGGNAETPTHLQPQVDAPFAEKLEAEKRKREKGVVTGEIRGVETLGAWAGGSLVAGLKVKGVVEIDRDSFLANGLAGAKKEAEIAHATQRMSLGTRLGQAEKGGWTLGAWA